MQRKTTTLSLLLLAGMVSGCSFSFSTYGGGGNVPSTKYAYSDPAPATTSSGVTRKPITKRADPATPATKPADPQRIPAASEPQRTEPTREPTRTSPTREPTRTEPTRTEPTRTEPTRTPTRTEPTRTPTRTEPTRTPTRPDPAAKTFKRPTIAPVQPSNPPPTSAALDRSITRSSR